MYSTILNIVKKPASQDRIAFIYIKKLLKIIILDEQIDIDANKNSFFYFKLSNDISKLFNNYSIEFKFYDIQSKCDVTMTIPKNFINNNEYRCIHNIIHKNEYLDYTKDELVNIRYNNKLKCFQYIFINNQK